MKTSFIKKLMMPLAIMAIGIAGAFVTMSMSSTASLTTVQGYKHVSQANPCQSIKMCSTIFSPTICTSGSQRLWGKVNPSDNFCFVPLYKIPN